MFSRFFRKKSPGSSSDEKAQTSKASSLPNLSTDKLRAMIISLNQAEPIFRKAGYIIEQLDVEFGQSPKLTPHFRRQQPISDEQHDNLLRELDDQPLIKFMLISLQKSTRMQALFDSSELYFYGMEIDISSVPSVRTIFKRKEQVAEVVKITP